MTIALAADHGGFQLKESLKTWLAAQGYDVRDFGATELDPADDYPDFGRPAAEWVGEDPTNRRGIVLCKSGEGMAIVANKVHGVRAILVTHADEFSNDEAANVLALDGMLPESEATAIVAKWLDSLKQPLAERHQRRIGKIE